MKKYFTYIIYSENSDMYYIGSTSNLDDRLARHNSDRSKFTKNKGPWKLVAVKEFSSRSDAYNYEMKLKSFKNSAFALQYIRN